MVRLQLQVISILNVTKSLLVTAKATSYDTVLRYILSVVGMLKRYFLFTSSDIVTIPNNCTKVMLKSANFSCQ
jgi:hypothetical protein